MIRIHTSVIILIVIFVVVDIFGSASTSNSTCCGCFQRRNRDTLLEMYSVRTRYNTYKHRSEAVRPLKCLTNENLPNKFKKNSKCSQGNDNFEECEFADDAISLDKTCINRHYTSLHNVIYKKNNWNPYITVNGTEELPCIHKYYLKNISIKTTDVGKVSKNEFSFDNLASTDKIINNVNKHSCCLRQVYGYCTLPKNRKKKICNSKYLFKNIIPPKRITSDGTHIYYWCDLQKIENTELDDGAYNPLWTMRGFTQTFHFWKENRRAQSVPLNAFLTYITLPWWSIAKDILDHREGPILTF